MQALWFEGLVTPSLTTEEGVTIEILHPGDWNHTAGPDFSNAALRWAKGDIKTGPVELHLKPGDWHAHGHHEDPVYDATMLHVVWASHGPRYFPATYSFRAVPQVVLNRHLAAPWEELRPHVQSRLRVLSSRQAPQNALVPGWVRTFAAQSRSQQVAWLRTAGAERLHRKAQRLLGTAAKLPGDALLRQGLLHVLAEGDALLTK